MALPKVCWDVTMPVEIFKSIEEHRIERWDRWFVAAGLEEEWSKIKQACYDTGQGHTEILRWAEIIELTRLEGIVQPDVVVSGPS